MGLFLEPPGPLLTHLHTVYMAYSECLSTRLDPLAERTCFPQVQALAAEVGALRQALAAAGQVASVDIITRTSSHCRSFITGGAVYDVDGITRGAGAGGRGGAGGSAAEGGAGGRGRGR